MQDPSSPGEEINRTILVPGGIVPVGRVAAHPIDHLAVPGYEILSKLGEGGMGVVYHARHIATDRSTALKLMLASGEDVTDGLARFLAEAEAVAAVRHPHVVGVYEFGQHAGRPYLALEYLAGGTLADRLTKGDRLAPIDAARLVEKLARAAHTAHAAGIVHRDLKPSNVLFDESGEPRITDFGLAKRAAVSLTATQAMMGSPAYMPPEQARGEARFIGPGADVWALGVILYECLSGTRPFRGDSPGEVLRKVIATDPIPLTHVAPGVPAPLDLVCRKCLEKNPQDRYASAADLAADLHRFAGGQSVHVRPAGLLSRTFKLVQRKPATAIAYGLTAATIALISISTVVAVLWRQAEAARGDAVETRDLLKKEKATTDETLAQLVVAEAKSRAEKEDADRAKKEAVIARSEAELQRRNAESASGQAAIARERAERFEYAAKLGSAVRDWAENDLASARSSLRVCNPAYRGWEWRFADRLNNSARLRIPANTPLVMAVYSQDGGRVAIAEASGTVRICDGKTGMEHRVIPGDGVAIRSVAFSSDGTRLVTAGVDGAARVWDAKTGAKLASLAGHKTVLTASFNPDGTKVVTAGGPGPARVWDVASGKEVLQVGEDLKKPMAILSAAFSPDGSKILTAGTDGSARIWEATNGQYVRSFSGHLVASIAVFSPDGSKVATAGIEGKVFVWDALTGAKLSTPAVAAERENSESTLAPLLMRFVLGERVAAEWHNSLAFTRDGKYLATAGSDGVVRVWNSKSGLEVRAVKVQRNGIRSVAFGPDPAMLLTAEDRAIRIWDWASPSDESALPGRAIGVRYLALSPNLTQLLVETPDQGVAVWETRTARVVSALKTRAGAAAVFSRDGKWVAITGENGVHIFDSANGVETASFAPKIPGTAVAFTPDADRIALGTADGVVRVWDIKTGTEMAPLRGHREAVRTVAYSGDGTRLITSGTDGTVCVWNVIDGRELFRIPKSESEFRLAALSAEGRRIVTTRADGETQVWNTSGGLPLVLGSNRVESVGFSPDGSRVVTGNAGGWVRLWDASSGAEVFARHATDGPADIVGFSTDGNVLFGGGRGSQIKMWEANPIDRTSPQLPMVPR